LWVTPPLGTRGPALAASTIPPLSVWPCGTRFSNTQEGPDRCRSAPITDPLFRGFGIPNRSPDPLAPRAGRDHPSPILAGIPPGRGRGLSTLSPQVGKTDSRPSLPLPDVLIPHNPVRFEARLRRPRHPRPADGAIECGARQKLSSCLSLSAQVLEAEGEIVLAHGEMRITCPLERGLNLDAPFKVWQGLELAPKVLQDDSHVIADGSNVPSAFPFPRCSRRRCTWPGRAP